MSDKLVWSSNMTQDYFINLINTNPGAAKEELQDYGYEPDMLAQLDEEGLRDLVYSDDYMWQDDAGVFEESIVPMINKQTKDGIVLMSGTADRWDGDRSAGIAVMTEDLVGGDLGSDSNGIDLYDVNGQLVWQDSHHDGNDYLKLYALPEDPDRMAEFIEECLSSYIEDAYASGDEALVDLVDSLVDEVDIDTINNWCDFSKVPEVCEPIRNLNGIAVGESLDEELSEVATKTGREDIIKDWVAANYPDEFQIDNIKPDMTFQELENLMKQGEDVYEVASVDGMGFDSAVREEIFNGMSEILGKPYDYFYDLWLFGIEGENNSIPESLKESEEPMSYEDAKAYMGSKGLNLTKDVYNLIMKMNGKESDMEEGCSLDEAKSKNVEALTAELESLKADYEDFGPEGFYAVPFTSFSAEFPEFTKTCILTWLNDMELADPDELADTESLNDTWAAGELILPDDWEILLDGAERLTTTRKDKGIQWEKINAAHAKVD